jgi:hypothetical protein
VVNDAYAIDAETTAEGVRPAHIKERIRALGPDRAPRPDAEAGRSRRRQLGDLMYKYDQYDQAMVDARVEEFRDQVRRRIDGHLTEDQFRRCA